MAGREEESLRGGQDVKEGTEIPRFHKNFRKQLFPNPLHCPELSSNLHKSWEVITKPELPQPQVISSRGLDGFMYKGPLELGPGRAQSCSPDHPESMAQLSAQRRMKLMALQLLLWQSALWSGREAVPLVTVSALPPSLPLPRSFLLKSLEQVRKIQASGSVLLEQLCATYKLCHPEELVLLGHSLGIPKASLSGCSSQALQQTQCLSQLHSGLCLYQGLLQALSGISPALAPTLDLLQLDVANFATTIWQQMENLGVAPTVQPTQSAMPAFTSAFQRRAGGVLAISYLQGFLETARLALHHLA